jgi:hypothetical protein
METIAIEVTNVNNETLENLVAFVDELLLKQMLKEQNKND